jgi:hypothetical protein
VEHLHNGSTDTVNVIHKLDIEVVRPSALVISAHPGRLMLRVTSDAVSVGKKRRFTTQFQIYLDGVYIGRASAPATAFSRNTFQTVRRRLRGSEPPLSSNLPQVPAGSPVEPRRVGREHSANVLLTDAVVDQGTTSSRLGLSPRNRSILDHEYDHFPAMSLMEAARQAGLLALGRIAGRADAAAQMRATGLRATFERFAELDSSVTIRARPLNSSQLPDGQLTVATEYYQDGHAIATVQITYSPIHTQHP